MINEKKNLIKNIINEIEIFDKNIDWMKNEKIKLDFELKLAELRLFEIFRELLEIEFYED